MSYESWSLVVQIIGLVLVIAFSALIRKRKPAYFVAVLLMLSANILGQLKIANEGPGACVGFIVLPIYGVILAHFTIKITNYLMRRYNKYRYNK